MKKFEICLTLAAVMLTVGIFGVMQRADTPDTALPPPAVTAAPGEESTPPSEEASPAAANIKKHKYTVKYTPNGVVLITHNENGEDTETPLADINAAYLTEVDIEKLTEGIELEDEEALYKLLEDYSS